MFERTLDTEHVFGHDGPMSRTRVRRRRRIAAALGSVAVAIVLSAPVAGALGRHGQASSTKVQPARRWEQVVVVQSGDTVWSIAEAAADGADPRAWSTPSSRGTASTSAPWYPGSRSSSRASLDDARWSGTVRAATTCCGPRSCDALGATPTTIASSIPGPRTAARRSDAGGSVCLRAPVHVVRAGRGRGPGGRQAGRLQGSVRPGQARERHPEGHQEPAGLPGAGGAGRRQGRGAAPAQRSGGHVAGRRRRGPGRASPSWTKWRTCGSPASTRTSRRSRISRAS